MPSRTPIQQRGASAKLVIRALNASAQRGYLKFGAFCVPCALGRSGVKALKREGDGATPRGRFPLREVYYKPRQGSMPGTILQRRALSQDAGWCDSPSDRNYNRPVSLPYKQSAERLWREDGIYDVIVVIGYNDIPRIKNRGSAVFMHLARSGFPATDGCIALRPADLRRVLKVVPRGAQIVIEI